jgi:hypothetical protein
MNLQPKEPDMVSVSEEFEKKAIDISHKIKQAQRELEVILRKMHNPQVPESKKDGYPYRIRQLNERVIPKLVSQFRGI